MIARVDNHQKRFNLSIKVMKELLDYNLKIYGDGLDRSHLEEIIKKYK